MKYQNIEELRLSLNRDKIKDSILVSCNNSKKYILEAYLIRCVEEGFLKAFSKGIMNGTVHTCVGQELSAVAIAGQLNENDWVTSNHRCHGHFISKTKNWNGLVDELLGKYDGVSKGIGSSQHLYYKGFLSNGPQGNLLPVGTGISKYLKKEEGVVASFIGEGTLNEGVTSESLNLASVYNLPQIFVCENNFYSQSTSQEKVLSGLIEDRFKAFNIKVFAANTWNIEEIIKKSKECIDYTRDNKLPSALIVTTYRLNAHSKGDDDRDKQEINFFNSVDPLNIIKNDTVFFKKEFESIEVEVNEYFDTSEKKDILKIEDYASDQLPRETSENFIDSIPRYNGRSIERINKFLLDSASNNNLIIGEDIDDPYGGAFKATKGISSKYPESIMTSPISEAGIVGFAAGYSLVDKFAIVEIMFGDFITYSFDQIVNGISKFYHMYGMNISCPVMIRTPMGGKRGYGPTHSQSLEKFLCGIDNLLVIALNSIEDPYKTLADTTNIYAPKIIIENKNDYVKKFPIINENLRIIKNDILFGYLLIEPRYNDPDITIITYGDIAREILDNFESIVSETNSVPQVICIQQLNPLDIKSMIKIINKTNKVLVIEDGSSNFGISAEVIAQLFENKFNGRVARHGAKPFPIPSQKTLESDCLVSIKSINFEINKILND